MCILKGFPTTLEVDDVVPVRRVVREPTPCTWPMRATATTRSRRPPAATPGRRADHGRAAEVGLQRTTAAGSPTRSRPGSTSAPVRRAGYPKATTRRPGCRGPRPPTACATSPAGSTERHGDDLGDHLHRQRRRRPGRRPEQARRGHRQPGRDASRRELPDLRVRRFRRGAARRVVHPRNSGGRPLNGLRAWAAGWPGSREFRASPP